MRSLLPAVLMRKENWNYQKKKEHCIEVVGLVNYIESVGQGHYIVPEVLREEENHMNLKGDY